MKLITKPSSNPYSEISQTKKCTFSWLEAHEGIDTFEELFSPVKCKDYLEDLLVACKLGLTMKDDVYGFRYEESVDVSDRIWMSVHFGSNEELQRVRRSLHILHRYEDEPTNCFPVFNSDTTIILSVPQFWLQSPLTFSVYTFLIRTFTYNEGAKDWRELFESISKGDGNDAKYCHKFLENSDLDVLLFNIEKVLGDNPLSGCDDSLISQEMFDNTNFYNEAKFNVYSLHDGTGLKSLSNQVNSLFNVLDSSAVAGREWSDNYYKLLKGIDL